MNGNRKPFIPISGLERMVLPLLIEHNIAFTCIIYVESIAFTFQIQIFFFLGEYIIYFFYCIIVTLCF